LDITNPDNFSSLSKVSAADLKNVFPPLYRPFSRATTRHYESLDALPSVQANHAVVVDGLLTFDNLSSRPFGYAGKGLLYSEGPTAPRLQAPIAPFPGSAPPGSYLSIVYNGP